jgi:hypothetical protein
VNSFCTTLLLAASLSQVSKQTTVEGVSLSIQMQHDAKAITVTLRTAVRGRSQFLFNPQYSKYLGVPGRLDVYNQQGKYLGDLIPVIDPFGRLKRLSSDDWFYLRDTGVVESQLRFRLDDVRVFQDRERVPLIPGEEYLPLMPSETYIFQLVADERFLSTPSEMDRFERGSKEEGA